MALLEVGYQVEFGGSIVVEMAMKMRVRGLLEKGARKVLRPHF